MNYLKQFDSYSLITSKHNRKTFNRKSGIVWGCKGNNRQVILYLTKPKFIKQEDFEEILEKITLGFK